MIIDGDLSEYLGLPGLSPNEAREVRGAAGRVDERSSEVFGIVPDDGLTGELYP